MKRKDIPRPYNGGQWTLARMRSFVMSALRRAQWPVKYECINKAFVEKGLNPKTGRPCKLHRCPSCQDLFPAKDMQADHIDPVVPLDGQWGNTTEWLGYNWNELLPRLFAEEEAYQALCHTCHQVKSQGEKEERKRIASR